MQVTAHDPLIGAQFGQYRIVEQIGQGGMAAIYRAHQARIDRDVALKVLPRDLAADSEFVVRFEREARAIARLEHPHILPVYDFGHTDDGLQYMVMRYIEGGRTLHDELCQPFLEERRIVRWTTSILRALDYAHQRSTIHRDIKPSNVLIDIHDEALLADFGIAKLIEEGAAAQPATQAGLMIGTPTYMAPEQALGHAASPRSDLYAVGVLLYQLLSGRAPFQADNPLAIAYQHVNTPPPPLEKWRPNLAKAFNDIVMKALAKAPEARFESAGEMAAALDVLSFSTDAPTVPQQPEVPAVAETPTLVFQPVVAQPSDTQSDQTLQPPQIEVSQARQAIADSGGSAAQRQLALHLYGSEAHIGGRDRLRDGRRGPTMMIIPPGHFCMGSPSDEVGRYGDEEQCDVDIDVPFLLGRYAITFELFDAYCLDSDRPLPRAGRAGRGLQPVVNVTWDDACDFAAWLGVQTGKVYRLPTEAEWEYACRAETRTAFEWGVQVDLNRANYQASGSPDTTVEVNRYAPNAWGLYQMHGNVWEWTASYYRRRYDGSEQSCAPRENEAYFDCARRGGSWREGAAWIRAASRGLSERNYSSDDLGFRLMREL